MKRTLFFILMISVVALLVIVGIILADKYLPNGDNTSDIESTEESSASRIDIAPKESIDDDHLRDVDYLYEEYDPYSVETMYLTVSYGNATDGTNHTWAEINTYSAYYYDELGIDRYQVAALLQVGDENGPVEGQLGYGKIAPNATVQIRGQTSSRNSQKGYKIKLYDSSEGWRGQKTIALNKHQTDGLRFRNKLAYDLISEIPQMMGLRTQFVHLYVRDLTGDNPDQFVDYGLYTQVEQLNKKALKTHGLDKYGYLYKINYFEFLEENHIKLITDPEYNEDEFNEDMETKGRSDHERLIEMIKDVNDYSLSSDQVLDKWFDRENLSYWMAFMMLYGNSDVQSRNVYIYSYLNGQKWYFYPWDNDAGLMDTENAIHDRYDFMDWEDGVTNYWGNMAFRRALLSESFREELIAAVEDLYHNVLNPEKVFAQAKKYSEIVLPYLYSMPDIKNAMNTREEYDTVLNAIPKEIEANYKRFYESLKSPMPFYVALPAFENGKTEIVWDSSLCFEESKILYHMWLGKDPYGEEKLMELDNIVFPRATYDGILEPGQYFIHVCATNAEGYNTNCFDYYGVKNGDVFGIYSFFVDEDGSISAFEEVE